ncbi:hypothetical protein [Nitrobacter sp. 62-13]|uniref:hypothetical protein n=1 Tax=Nitrobacter sp. 62-13 TaxID=1895797 RepID=UPI000B14EC37|nr:hypothetical protein [Nitrobacter sp. 62-13]
MNQPSGFVKHAIGHLHDRNHKVAISQMMACMFAIVVAGSSKNRKPLERKCYFPKRQSGEKS